MRDVDRVFEQCPDCGKYLVKLGPHSCDAGESRTPTREQRTRIAESDPRPDGDLVLLLPTRKVDGSYAYHEATDGHTPVCGGGGALDDDEWRVLTRREARDRGRSPCMTCLRLSDDGDTAMAVTAASDGADTAQVGRSD
ncbi:hypothetical protein [Halorarius litoreus]|uniref:hypothetical protein n=1 Tax=Halorarius litoreus TaxID=2962676 RepID=UPI0020CEBCFC|nr:hypothetical protein [Halorarius litoreus]